MLPLLVEIKERVANPNLLLRILFSMRMISTKSSTHQMALVVLTMMKKMTKVPFMKSIYVTPDSQLFLFFLFFFFLLEDGVEGADGEDAESRNGDSENGSEMDQASQDQDDLSDPDDGSASGSGSDEEQDGDDASGECDLLLYVLLTMENDEVDVSSGTGTCDFCDFYY